MRAQARSFPAALNDCLHIILRVVAGARDRSAISSRLRQSDFGSRADAALATIGVNARGVFVHSHEMFGRGVARTISVQRGVR